MTNALITGKIGEQLAAQYLSENGLTILNRNYHSRFGEIDIVAKEAQTIVFIEVRVRNNLSFGHALESITLSKQKKIIQTAYLYMQKNHCSLNMRIDVIGITGTNAIFPEIQWIKNAFSE